MKDWCILDTHEEVVADYTSPVGCWRAIADASDDPLGPTDLAAWHHVRDHLAEHESITVQVAGGPVTYRVVPRSEVEACN